MQKCETHTHTALPGAPLPVCYGACNPLRPSPATYPPKGMHFAPETGWPGGDATTTRPNMPALSYSQKLATFTRRRRRRTGGGVGGEDFWERTCTAHCVPFPASPSAAGSELLGMAWQATALPGWQPFEAQCLPVICGRKEEAWPHIRLLGFPY